MTDDTIKNMKNLQAQKSLTPKRKAELNKAVKKTVKQYRTTLELLAKT
jgi:phosphoenolpyruvate carboxylase